MDYNDPAPPDFHAKDGQDQVVIRIKDGQMVEVFLSARAHRLIEEWRLHHL